MKSYSGPERRKFIRLSYRHPFRYKVCKKDTISKLLSGYTQDISQAGLLCTLKEKVPLNSILWLALDIGALSLCEEIEKNSVIIQRGILGKVVRVRAREDGSYDVGIRFLTRQEKSSSFSFLWEKME